MLYDRKHWFEVISSIQAEAATRPFKNPGYLWDQMLFME